MWAIALASAAATATEFGINRSGKLGLSIQLRLALPDGACPAQERWEGNGSFLGALCICILLLKTALVLGEWKQEVETLS